MITCIFGLTACGSEETYTDYEQRKMDTAIQIATQYVIPSLENFEDEATLESFSEYTADEVAYLVQENVGITVDGYAYKTAIESFNSAKKSIGGITAVGDAEAAIDDDQIIVHVDVTGAKQNAQAEVIFTNDMFLSMESAALNPVESMGGLMTKAALNTLIGMGTVFVMLIIMKIVGVSVGISVEYLFCGIVIYRIHDKFDGPHQVGLVCRVRFEMRISPYLHIGRGIEIGRASCRERV